tara:strand:- start:1032 stop:1760 length:729 start_codon:yes stop_codon:yes gene_type:complete
MHELNHVRFKDSISIVIPLHNKEMNIESTIELVVKYISSPKLQIIIVENESTDSSKLIAQNSIEKFNKNVEIALYESKKGLGNALIEGFKHCKNEWIYFMPADFSFGNSDIEFITKNNLFDKYELFIGSKGHSDSVIKRKTSRKIYTRFFNFIINNLFNINIGDTQGTLIFKSDLLNKISNLRSKEFLITAEIIIKSLKKDLDILEIPIVDHQVKSISTVSPFKDGIKMLIQLIGLRIKIMD